MSRWPNTPHWQRFEAALRIAYGTSWLRGGEKFFGLDRGELRRALDRELPKDLISALEDQISWALRDQACEMQTQAAKFEWAAAAFDGASEVRRFDAKTARIKDWNNYVDAFARESLAHMQQEAA
jgi:hypothetical protein